MIAAVAGIGIVAGGLTACGSQQAAPTAQVVVQDKQAGIGLKITEWLAEEADGTLGYEGVVGLLESLTGGGEGEDPNKERFAEVDTKLEGISEQLTVMQEGVNTLIAKSDSAAYKDTLIALRGYANSVEHLYDTYFMPITGATAKLVADKTAGADAATLIKDRAAVAKANADFQNAYQTGDATYRPQAKDIHDFLMPGGASVLHDKGAVLMDKGYVTVTDSDELRAVYDLWADYEATAALMASAHAYLGGATPAAKNLAATAKIDKWTTWRTAELDELPPVVPVGHIVITPNGSLEGATEFAPALAGHNSDSTLTKSVLWWPTGPTGQVGKRNLSGDWSHLIDAPAPNSSKWWLYTGDVRAEGDATGWKLPSGAQFKQLTDKAQGSEPNCSTSATPTSCNLMHFASKAFGDHWNYGWQSPWNQPRYWLADTTATNWFHGLNYEYHNLANLTGTTALFGPASRVWTTDPAGTKMYEAGRPVTASTPSDIADMDQGVTVDSLGNGEGSILLTKAPADYMAQE